jgi:hypothetical protein
LFTIALANTVTVTNKTVDNMKNKRISNTFPPDKN